MSKTIISLEEIEEKLRLIRAQKAELEDDERFYERAKNTFFISASLDNGSHSEHRVLGLDEILIDAFVSFPNQRFTDDHIAELLATKRREGTFVADARNLRRYARPALRRLVDTGIIRQGGSEENPWWQKL